MQSIGYRLILEFARPPAKLVEAFRGLPTSTISDSMGRFGTAFHAIRPISGTAASMVGPAFTVRTRPGDNLLIHKAIQAARPGDVLIIEGQADDTAAFLGELMTLRARKCGIAGMVVDGLVRDRKRLEEIGLPVFARGVSPRGPHKDGPGELNVIVSIGGIPVSPGDVVVGDPDGVVFVPRERAEEIQRAAHAKQQSEIEQVRKIEAGSYDDSWIDKQLRDRGFQV